MRTYTYPKPNEMTSHSLQVLFLPLQVEVTLAVIEPNLAPELMFVEKEEEDDVITPDPEQLQQGTVAVFREGMMIRLNTFISRTLLKIHRNMHKKLRSVRCSNIQLITLLPLCTNSYFNKFISLGGFSTCACKYMQPP